MLRVTSRQRLVSWDAFDAAAGVNEDHDSTALENGEASSLTERIMVNDISISEIPSVLSDSLEVKTSPITMTATMKTPTTWINHIGRTKNKEDPPHIVDGSNFSSNAEVSDISDINAAAVRDINLVGRDKSTSNGGDDGVGLPHIEDDVGSIHSEGGYLTCASRNDSAFFFSMDDDDVHHQPQPPTLLGQDTIMFTSDVDYSVGGNLYSPPKRHRKKRDRDYCVGEKEDTIKTDNVNNASSKPTSSLHNHISQPDVTMRRNVSFSASAPEVMFTTTQNNESAKDSVNGTHCLFQSHYKQDAYSNTIDGSDVIFPHFPAESCKPRRNESCMSFLTACASADSMDDEVTMNSYYLERNRSQNRRRSLLSNEVTRILTGCSSFLGSSLRGALEDECTAGLLEMADDIKEIVFSFLCPREVRALGATCHSLQALSRTSHVWSYILRNDFPLLKQVSESYYKNCKKQLPGHHYSNSGVLFKYSDDFGIPLAPTPECPCDNKSSSTNVQERVYNRSSANLSVLHSLAQPYPTHVDELLFQPSDSRRSASGNGNATAAAASNAPPVSFKTYKYDLVTRKNGVNKHICVPVVQFTGEVGTGDRCVQSNVPFPSLRASSSNDHSRHPPVYFTPWPRHVAPHFGASVVAASLRHHQQQTTINALPKWCPQTLFDLVRRGGSSTMMCMEEGALSSAVTSMEQERSIRRGNNHNASVTDASRRAETLHAERTSQPLSGNTTRGSAPTFTPTTTAAETLRRYGAPSPFAGVQMPSLPAMPTMPALPSMPTMPVLPAMPSMPVAMRPPTMNPAQMMSRIWNLCGTTTLKPFVAPYVIERDTCLDKSLDKIEDTDTLLKRTTADGPIVEVNMSPRLFAYFEVTILPRDPMQEPNAVTATSTSDRELDDLSHPASQGSSDCIAIGLATRKFDARHKMPGWCPHSYGYHGDDGGIFHGAGDMLRQFGPRFGSTSERNESLEGSNDVRTTVVGCGIDYANSGIFFTLNGTFLGYGWRGISLDEPLYPTVGVDSNSPLELNFGHRPFTFDVTRAFGTHHKALIETIFHQQHHQHNHQRPSSLTAPLSSSI